MSVLQSLLEQPPFSLPSAKKSALYRVELQKLTAHHYEHCAEYRRIIDALKFDPSMQVDAAEVPFLPVSLFKRYELSSIDKSEVVTTLRSSGTSQEQVSRITLDKATGVQQKRILSKITADFVGSERLPMLVLDSASILKDRAIFTARGAGILGFGILGKDTTYAFDDKMNLDLAVIEAFLERHRDHTILLFGFTFMVWAHFYLALKRQGRRLPLENGVLIHGGGWKKLQDQAVDAETFGKRIFDVSGIRRIHNYYGMAEQTGSIFMECERGHFHCSSYSDIFIRRNDFSLCSTGERGVIELVSLLPRSYPGHVLLSEDVGELLGEDDCSCGRLGKYFRVYGRLENAELRGCSDTYKP